MIEGEEMDLLAGLRRLHEALLPRREDEPPEQPEQPEQPHQLKRQIEHLLRDAGYSKRAAKSAVAAAFTVLGDGD